MQLGLQEPFFGFHQENTNKEIFYLKPTPSSHPTWKIQKKTLSFDGCKDHLQSVFTNKNFKNQKKKKREKETKKIMQKKNKIGT